MKTKKELQKLSNAIGNAIMAYHDAIFDNLKESGKEHGVETDWEDEDSKGLHLSIVGCHDDLVVLTIDKVRVNPEKGVNGVIEAHICEEDYDGCDYWMMAFELGDDADYLYDNIIW
jgi:hypothetical protein